MTQNASLTETAREQAQQAVRQMGPWVKLLARAGLVAKGVLYCTIGAIAVMGAIGSRDVGAATGSKGALHELRELPFGQVLLVLMAVGLAGYSLWRFVQAVLDPEHEGDDAGGLAKRFIRLVIALVHVGLVVYVIGLITGIALGGGGGGARGWTAELMSWPFGLWLVGFAGLAIAAYGGNQIYKGVTTDLDDELNLRSLGSTTQKWLRQLGRLGLVARGVIFILIGGFLVVAAFRTDPNQAKDLGEALQVVQGWTLGWLLLAAVALGLIAYGLYQFVRAGYRRIKTT